MEKILAGMQTALVQISAHFDQHPRCPLSGSVRTVEYIDQNFKPRLNRW